jgi:hypothetical protein
MGTIAAIAVLLLVLAWFFWPSDAPGSGRSKAQRPDVDEQELEEAEREVQEAPDQDSVRDWGPGVQKPPLP